MFGLILDLKVCDLPQVKWGCAGVPTNFQRNIKNLKENILLSIC